MTSSRPSLHASRSTVAPVARELAPAGLHCRSCRAKRGCDLFTANSFWSERSKIKDQRSKDRRLRQLLQSRAGASSLATMLCRPKIHCGSELAREGGVTVNEDVECAGLFASRLPQGSIRPGGAIFLLPYWPEKPRPAPQSTRHQKSCCDDPAANAPNIAAHPSGCVP